MVTYYWLRLGVYYTFDIYYKVTKLKLSTQVSKIGFKRVWNIYP